MVSSALLNKLSLASSPLFERPSFGHCLSLLKIVDYKAQPMFVVAVKDFDIHACLGHAAGDLAELARFSLVHSLNEDVSLFQNPDACPCECAASGGSVRKEEVSHSLAVNHEGAATLNADAGAAQGVAHLGQSARPVFKCNRQILHGLSFRVYVYSLSSRAGKAKYPSACGSKAVTGKRISVYLAVDVREQLLAALQILVADFCPDLIGINREQRQSCLATKASVAT